jgi:hypothetical protein
VPAEDAADLRDDDAVDTDSGPAKPYDDLNDSERATRLAVWLAEAAADHGGKWSVRPEDAREEVLTATPGPRKVKRLTDRMADTYNDFETDAKGGSKRLKCDLAAVLDHMVLDEAGVQSRISAI